MKSFIKLFFSLILLLTPFLKGLAQNGPSLIIKELMINPNNAPSLPASEYIELHNVSSQTIDLRSITLHVNNNQQLLPNYRIAPNQYVILCSQEAQAQFMRYGNALALTRWYALNNTSATFRLTQGEITLDEVSYRDSWYNSTSKRNGGWSLERINPNWTCNINWNWSASHSLSGGTLGKSNTILDKKFIPQLNISSYKINQNRVELSFNISPIYLSNNTEATFLLNRGIGKAQKVEIADDKIELTFKQNLDAQKLYSLRIEGLKICNLELPVIETKLFEQKEIKVGDILINEILFNTKEGGVHFVELYNTTSFPIKLQHFKLGNRTISTEFTLLEPQQYLAITTNKNILLQHYPNAISGNIIQTALLPPYANQQGQVTLYSNHNILIDFVFYTANMHAAHLINLKGISLERTSISNATFHSASTLQGGATPGYQNSTLETFTAVNKIELTSKTISPNGDGYEDELEIIYELDKPNYIIAVEIDNDKAQLVEKLAHQNLAGTHGSIIWDGKNNSGTTCKQGYYICFTHIFNHEGKTQKFKQPFVLINSLTRH